MTIASAPSTPAAHSSARWPDENVRRAGWGDRWWLPVARVRDVGAGARPVASGGLLAMAGGTAAGAARPIEGAAFGRGGRRPARTAATASANGPPDL